MLAIEDALSIIRRLIERSDRLGAPIHHTIVAVGGTALSAHGIRPESEDVDLFVRTFSDDAVFELERELRATHGESFRLDVTGTENLWGAILLRDIEERSPLYRALEVNGRAYAIKALAVEDLFLLKLSADREKDRRDLPLLAARTTPGALIERFNTLARWHGNRGAVLGYADEFVRRLETLYGLPPPEVIPQLHLPHHMQELLWESHSPTPDRDMADDLAPPPPPKRPNPAP